METDQSDNFENSRRTNELNVSTLQLEHVTTHRFDLCSYLENVSWFEIIIGLMIYIRHARYDYEITITFTMQPSEWTAAADWRRDETNRCERRPGSMNLNWNQKSNCFLHLDFIHLHFEANNKMFGGFKYVKIVKCETGLDFGISTIQWINSVQLL